MKLQILIVGSALLLLASMLGYAFYNYRPAIHRPAPQPDPVAAEPVAVATPTETPKHVMTHLELVTLSRVI